MSGGFFKIFESRRSIRRYSLKKVSDEVLFKILESVHNNSPSAGNVQACYFVVVEEEDLRIRLSVECNDQYWMSQAPVHLVVISNNPRLERSFGKEEAEWFGVQNCAVFINNVLLSANALGLGSCWVGSFKEDKVKEIIECPEGLSVQGVVTLGYPQEEPPRPKREALRDFMGFERFRSQRYIKTTGSWDESNRYWDGTLKRK